MIQRPAKSTTSAPLNHVSGFHHTDSVGGSTSPTAVIRPFCTTSVAFSTASAPVPSQRVAPVKVVVCAATGEVASPAASKAAPHRILMG